MRLVGDIGGTNSRLALSQNGEIVPQSARSFNNDGWVHLYDIIAVFLKERGVQVDDMVLAVAGPVSAKSAALTNRDWTITCDELVERHGCVAVHLINDLSALGYAAPTLGPSQLGALFDSGGEASQAGQFLIVGLGTGFNVSPVINSGTGIHCLAAEAGHVAMPQSICAALGDFGVDAARFATVEALFSGRGFEAFCQSRLGNRSLRGKAVIEGASEGRAKQQAVASYAQLLGQLLRELSLAYMPSSGIYIAGSVGRAVLEVAPQACMEVFEAPCSIRGARRSNLIIIDDDRAALNGCAAYS